MLIYFIHIKTTPFIARTLDANSTNIGDTMDGQLMTPETVHLDRETCTHGAVGHGEQLCSHKDLKLHHENAKKQVPLCFTHAPCKRDGVAVS
ncbi:predicted protein [Lichtheimia corymbifera JMRC:FSU:9682]|uniref:Uncharacterized protein n=1 Tax=Lichtheimia corymbifera JMRC:FSU:9682 TaxID=1263082 RepID=A0A068RGA5_9FUNG|nr:predicted protein [Lichtheimia corymbifera JMRC:FSU:9682]